MTICGKGRGVLGTPKRAGRRRPAAALLGGLLLSTLLLLPAPALAGRVAVLDFGGGSAGTRARAGLVRRLVGQPGIELVSRSTFADAGAKAGVAAGELITGSGIRRAAAVAAVDVVITGKVSGRGARARIWLDVYDADGQQRLHRGYRPSGGQLRSSDLDRIASFLLELAPPSEPAVPMDPPEDPLDDPPPDDPYGPDPDRDPPPDDTQPRDDYGPYTEPEPVRDPPPPRDGREPWERPDPAGPGGSGVGGSIDDPGRRPEPDDWAREPAGRFDPTAPGPERPPFVVFYLQGQMATRDYLLQGSFTTVEYRTQGVFPEIGGTLELMPAAMAGPWAQDLALEARGSYGFLASQFEDSTGTLQRRGTPVIRMAGDLRYRVPLVPKSAYSPRLGLRGGYYLSRFNVGLGNPLFRTVSHHGLRLGVDIRQPLLPPYVVLRLWGALMPFSSPGVAEATAYGPQASTTGYWVSAGLEGSTGPQGGGVTWKFSVELISQTDRFAGTGTEDANATATEEQLVISGGLGYAF